MFWSPMPALLKRRSSSVIGEQCNDDAAISADLGYEFVQDGFGRRHIGGGCGWVAPEDCIVCLLIHLVLATAHDTW